MEIFVDVIADFFRIIQRTSLDLFTYGGHGKSGQKGICAHDDNNDDGNDPADMIRDHSDLCDQKRINDHGDDDRSNPKKNQITNPYSAVDVAWFCAVVPPSGMVSFFQKPADKIFQNTAYDHTAKKYREDPIGKSQHIFDHDDDKNNTDSIDRAIWADQKSSIDKDVLTYENKQYFHAPAKKRKQEKDNSCFR